MVNGLFLRSIVKEVAANDYYIPCFSHYREGHGNKKKMYDFVLQENKT